MTGEIRMYTKWRPPPVSILLKKGLSVIAPLMKIINEESVIKERFNKKNC